MLKKQFLPHKEIPNHTLGKSRLQDNISPGETCKHFLTTSKIKGFQPFRNKYHSMQTKTLAL